MLSLPISVFHLHILLFPYEGKHGEQTLFKVTLLKQLGIGVQANVPQTRETRLFLLCWHGGPNLTLMSMPVFDRSDLP